MLGFVYVAFTMTASLVTCVLGIGVGVWLCRGRMKLDELTTPTVRVVDVARAAPPRSDKTLVDENVVDLAPSDLRFELTTPDGTVVTWHRNASLRVEDVLTEFNRTDLKHVSRES